MDTTQDVQKPVTEEEYIAWFGSVKEREAMPERLYQYFLNTYRQKFTRIYHYLPFPGKHIGDSFE